MFIYVLVTVFYELLYIFQGTSEEWRSVFYICAGLSVLGIVVFGTLSTGEIQPWSRTNMELIITNRETSVNQETEDGAKTNMEHEINEDAKDTTIEQETLLSHNERTRKHLLESILTNPE